MIQMYGTLLSRPSAAVKHPVRFAMKLPGAVTLPKAQAGPDGPEG